MRFPLYGKILLWFFLNLLLLAAIAFVVMRGQFRLGLEALLAGRGGDRVQSVADLFAAELRTTERSEWSELTTRFSEAYHVDFLLYRLDGVKLAGTDLVLPAEVRERLVDRAAALANRGRPGEPQFRNLGPDGGAPQATPPPRARESGPRPFEKGLRPPEGGPRQIPGELRVSEEGPRPPDAGPRRRDGAPQPPFPPMLGQPGPNQKFMVRAGAPARYWVGLRLAAVDQGGPRVAPLALLIASDSIRGGGLFFDFTPLVWGGGAAIALSVLLWLPFVRGVTRSVAQMTGATERIAEGRFDARVPEGRSDELGALATAVNRMARRLDGFVGGQKRFLGDISHELCAPIARIQLSLGILEQRGDENSREALADLREEVDHMSGLVNELLSFSKASLGGMAIKLQSVNVRDLVQKAVHRERRDGAEVRVEVADDLLVMADPELLLRALANLLRNAIRHAGAAGPILVSATPNGDAVEILVADCGPGVPADALPKLFDPFFRVDESRTRDTGGVGLGLTIVKTCVESCGGSVTCRNRQPSGLEVAMRLRAAV